MTLHQLFLIMRARHMLILVTLLVTIAAAVSVAMVLPPRYKATTTLVLDFKNTDPITGSFMPIQILLGSYMATEQDILESRTVALKVVKLLRLVDDPVLKQQFMDATGGKGSMEDWVATILVSKLEVKPSKESRVMEVSFTNPDPEYAAKLANAFAQAYIQTNLDMKTAPAKESATWFDGQLKELRGQYEEAQARLSKYQTEKGITSTDQKLDVETNKLAEISTQLVQIQAQNYENASRQKQLEDFVSERRSIDSLPEVLGSPVIQDLKSKFSAAETRLSQASNSVGVNHPDYQKAQSEVTGLRKKLRDEINTAASVISNNLRISQSRERELRDSLAAQKSRLLELNRHRDELGVLMKEVENAQRAYESASQRHTQTSLESRMDKSSIAVLAPAIPPMSPAFPKMRLIFALAVAVGGLLGMCFALIAELIDRRVRGVEDLVQSVGTHVWGVLEDTTALSRIVDRKSRKATKRGRFLRTLHEPTLR